MIEPVFLQWSWVWSQFCPQSGVHDHIFLVKGQRLIPPPSSIYDEHRHSNTRSLCHYKKIVDLCICIFKSNQQLGKFVTSRKIQFCPCDLNALCSIWKECFSACRRLQENVALISLAPGLIFAQFWPGRQLFRDESDGPAGCFGHGEPRRAGAGSAADTCPHLDYCGEGDCKIRARFGSGHAL